MTKILFALLGLVIPAAGIGAPVVPPGVARQLPVGYEVLSSVRMTIAQPNRILQIIAIGRRGESSISPVQNAHARPLLIFEWRANTFVLVGRNDAVILQADEGGQCDPFLDREGTIAVKGRFFTVENGVACGQHWTDFVTFRLDGRAGFVFDNERSESWSLNSSNDPDAEALVRDGPQEVRRSRPGRVIPFALWRRSH